MVDQIRFDQSMNKGRVLIENAFGTFKKLMEDSQKN
jgi:hypothetical protein